MRDPEEDLKATKKAKNGTRTTKTVTADTTLPASRRVKREGKQKKRFGSE